MSFAGEDAIAKIPERFSKQVLGYQDSAMIRKLSVHPFAPASRHCERKPGLEIPAATPLVYGLDAGGGGMV